MTIEEKLEKTMQLLFIAQSELINQCDWSREMVDVDQHDNETVENWREDYRAARACIVSIAKFREENDN